MNQPNLQTIELTITDGIAHAALNRPDKANALDQQCWDDIETCFKWIDAEPSIRVAILSGNGKHFCAGIDLGFIAGVPAILGEDIGRNGETLRALIKRLQGNLTAIEECRKPVLAAIHGGCIGGGIDMIACCDIRYCTEDAKFSIKEVDIGMAADVGTLQRLPKIIGDGITRELAYTGRLFDGKEAKQIQLVNQTYENKEAMLEAVTDIAKTIASKSPLAIRGTKEMLLYSRDHSVTEGLKYIATWNSSAILSKDLEKAVLAELSGETVTFDD